jgi:hypothetical protein
MKTLFVHLRSGKRRDPLGVEELWLQISESLYGGVNCKRYKVKEGYVSVVLSILERRCRRVFIPYLCPEDTVNELIENYSDKREERCE